MINKYSEFHEVILLDHTYSNGTFHVAVQIDLLSRVPVSKKLGVNFCVKLPRTNNVILSNWVGIKNFEEFV